MISIIINSSKTCWNHLRFSVVSRAYSLCTWFLNTKLENLPITSQSSLEQNTLFLFPPEMRISCHILIIVPPIFLTLLSCSHKTPLFKSFKILLYYSIELYCLPLHIFIKGYTSSSHTHTERRQWKQNIISSILKCFWSFIIFKRVDIQ